LLNLGVFSSKFDWKNLKISPLFGVFAAGFCEGEEMGYL